MLFPECGVAARNPTPLLFCPRGRYNLRMTTLHAWLDSRLPKMLPSAAVWLRDACIRQRGNYDQPKFLADFAVASRHSGKALLTRGDARSWLAVDPAFNPSTWTADEAARILLLLTVADAYPAKIFDCVTACIQYSDQHEVMALLKALPWLPEPRRFLQFAQDACRSNQVNVFTAIACENPYPPRYFAAHTMNHLVVKALFLLVPLRRIIGIDSTADADRARMALDWVEEREAAGRPFPTDLWRIVAPSAVARALPALQRYARHASPGQRMGVALALGLRKDAAARELLTAMSVGEQDATVLEVVRAVQSGVMPWEKLDGLRLETVK